MISVNRAKIDQAIENMGDMFAATKKVFGEYETEKKVLIKRGEDLNKRISELQGEHTQLLLDREIAKDNTNDYIKLSKKLTVANDEVQVIVSLQEQLKEDFKVLKQKHLPIIKRTYEDDLSAKNQFDVNEAVESARYEMLSAITDYAKEIKKQQSPLLPAISEFLEDAELMQNNRSFQRTFDFDSTHLTYSGELNQSFIHRNHIFSACGGNLHPEIQKPKV